MHELVGETTFTTSTTKAATVSLPQPVPLDDVRVNIDGGGRVYGFMMRRLGEYEQEGYRPVINGVTIGACSRPGCKSQSDFMFIAAFNVGKKLTGTWKLYVIADQAPVNITFKLKGIAGSQSIVPTDHVDSEIVTLEPTVDETNTHTIYSAGGFSKLDHVDFGMVGLWTIGEPSGGTAYGECLYYGKNQRVPEETAFMPGCPAADGDVAAAPPGVGGPGGIIFSSGAYGGTRGVGGWYATPAVVHDYGAVGFWIDK
ncbi:MAG: hypothetical protein QOG54_737 [Actinomycetota bacterium]|nr:hypothetical protein [Actinomycetota bacterium]